MDEKAKPKNIEFQIKPVQFFWQWILVALLFALPVALAVLTWTMSVIITVTDFHQTFANFKLVLGILVLLALIYAAGIWQKALLENKLALKASHWEPHLFASLFLCSVILLFSLPLLSASPSTVISYDPNVYTQADSGHFVLSDSTCFYATSAGLQSTYHIPSSPPYDLSITEYLRSIYELVVGAIATLVIFQILHHGILSDVLKTDFKHRAMWIFLPTLAALPFALAAVAFATAYLPDISQCEPALSLFLQVIRILGNPVMLLLTFLLIPMSEALVLIHLAKYQRREITTA